jgi:threonine aldolase
VEDHVRATRVAEAINAMENFSVDMDAVQSNLVYVNCNIPATEVVASLAEHGIDMFDLPYNRVRVAIHLHITDEDVERIIAAFAAQ